VPCVWCKTVPGDSLPKAKLKPSIQQDASPKKEMRPTSSNGSPDPKEPLVLVGTCNDWNADKALQHFRFSLERLPEGDRFRSRLRMDVDSDQVDFQILSASKLWHWRLCPHNPLEVLTADDGLQNTAVLVQSKDHAGKVADHRNFRLHKLKGRKLDICVELAETRSYVWCKTAQGEPPKPNLQPAPRPMGKPDPEEPILLVGSCNDWNPDTARKHFQFSIEKVPRGTYSRLGIDITTDRFEFQILSFDKLWDWRLYPRGPIEELKPNDTHRIPVDFMWGKDHRAANHRNFRVTKMKGRRIEILVAIAADGINVWCIFPQGHVQAMLQRHV